MKNNILKQTGILLLVVAMIYGQLGCKKFLDRKPLGTAIATDIKGGIEGSVFGLYSATKNWGMTQLPFITAHASRADDDLISTPGDGNEDFIDRYKYTKDYWLLDPLWDDHLGFIIKTSGVIKDIEVVQAGTPDPKNLIYKGEASFLRAYAYFDMVRDYGAVPKIDFKVVVADDANVPRVAPGEIYTLIESDLKFAAESLPVSWESKFIGRITKGAANALLAKVYLYRQNWATALTTAEAVISSSQYSLIPNYSDVFTEENENSKETIFAIQNYENDNGSVGGNAEYSCWSAGYQGVRGSGQWNLGWGWNLPSAKFVDSAFEAGDPRKGQTVLFSGQKDDYLVNDGKYGNTLPINTSWPHFNKKVYTNPARRAATGDNFGSWLDMIILRYSDVLLMAAEAANESGNTAKALGYLEQVRARARKGLPVLPQITSTNQAVVRTAIKRERRIELGLEYERFYDLVRWTPAATDTVDAPRVLGPLGYKAINALLPIPQGAIDKSQGKLTQNPGY
jgi:starch-binding outer membrane protein, SusD/RagB family